MIDWRSWSMRMMIVSWPEVAMNETIVSKATVNGVIHWSNIVWRRNVFGIRALPILNAENEKSHLHLVEWCLLSTAPFSHALSNHFIVSLLIKDRNISLVWPSLLFIGCHCCSCLVVSLIEASLITWNLLLVEPGCSLKMSMRSSASVSNLCIYV